MMFAQIGWLTHPYTEAPLAAKFALLISLIAAMSDRRVIGVKNRLPWHLPADLKWFRQQTMGKPILMGRLTFESIGRPLPGRTNIIVTRDRDYRVDGALVCHDIEAALAAAGDAEEIMVIGGATFYRQMMSRASRLYITVVHADIAGDAWFPEIDASRWREDQRIDHPADDANPYPYSFVIYNRLD